MYPVHAGKTYEATVKAKDVTILIKKFSLYGWLFIIKDWLLDELQDDTKENILIAELRWF